MFNFFKKQEDIPTENSLEEVKEDFENVVPIAEYFHKETGIIFDKQMSILKNKVISFCREKKIFSFKKLLNDIQLNKPLKQDLIDHLTTNETYFYREFKQIAQLVELVKEINNPISILCAPSSTGEEPYSIAIALLEAKIPSSHFKILGIDINSDAINKSHSAKYSERHIRNLSNDIIPKYFQKDDGKYILKESIKSLVSFRVINIFDDSIKNIGRFDFVFSRNMLIYFDTQTKLKAKEILEDLRKTDEYEVFFGHADLF